VTADSDFRDLDGPVPYRRPRRVGPVVMLVPVLLMLFMVLVLMDRTPDPGPRPEPPHAGEHLDVAGWSGELEAPLGERLTASLTGLHSEPSRQTFDKRALRARLGLAAGEPWLLTLRYLLPPRESSPEELVEASPGLSVADLFVADADGTALVPIAAPDMDAGDIADPLRTLLAPTSGKIFPGQTVHVFLWGREPRGDAELRGIPSPVAGGVEATIALHTKTVRRADGSLALLDRGAAGPLVEGGEDGR